VFNSHLRDLGSRQVLHSSRLCKLAYLLSWLKALAVKFSLLSSRSGLNFSFSVHCVSKKAVALKLEQIFTVFGTLQLNSPNFSMHALLSTSPHICLPQFAIYLDSRTWFIIASLSSS